MVLNFELALVVLVFFAVVAGIYLFWAYVNRGGDRYRERFEEVKGGLERVERALRDDIGKGRTESNAQAHLLRSEVNGSIKNFGEFLSRTFTDISTSQKGQLDIFSQQMANLTDLTQKTISEMKHTVDQRLELLQSDNNKKLDEMRHTVDEKLQSTLEKRLADSFQQVSERLELVHRGLGEMRTLTNGVGDLKKIFTNVKTRGTWGEVQLKNILEQTLTADQFEANVHLKKGSSESVEFAIKLPGQGGDDSEMVYLPIDSKFPMEDYQRLFAAQEDCDVEAVATSSAALEAAILRQAKTIRDKYITATTTTPFGIMFLPTEGLYLEVLNRPGLAEKVQTECSVLIAGPTNLTAMLTSLRMGFRTLAIQKRSGEIWKHLTTIKKDFSGFSTLLEGVQKKLLAASNDVERATTKSKKIEIKLNKFEDESPSEVMAVVEEPVLRLEE